MKLKCLKWIITKYKCVLLKVINDIAQKFDLITSINRKEIYLRYPFFIWRKVILKWYNTMLIGVCQNQMETFNFNRKLFLLERHFKGNWHLIPMPMQSFSFPLSNSPAKICLTKRGPFLKFFANQNPKLFKSS